MSKVPLPIGIDSEEMGHEIEDGEPETFEPYDVTCARCGKVLSCTEAVIEEGDEWECPPCWERCEAKERANSEQTVSEKERP